MHPPVVGDVRLQHEDLDVSKNRVLWLQQFSDASSVAEVGFESDLFSRRLVVVLAPEVHRLLTEAVDGAYELVYLHDSGTDPDPAALLDRWFDAVRYGGILAGRDLLVDRCEALVLAVEDLVAAGRADLHSVALAPSADWAVTVRRS